MIVKIEKYNEKLKEECLAVFNLCYTDNGPRKIFLFSEVVVAIKEERVIGIAAQERSELHDTIVVEYICVLPEYRRSGVGTKLHEFLVDTYPVASKETVDISCYSDQLPEQSFITKLQFKKYLNCYLNLFKPNKVDAVEAIHQISLIKDFYQIEGAKEKIKLFHVNRYKQEHDDNLPATDSEDVWSDYFDDGDINFGVVLHDQYIIHGVSFAYQDFGEEIDEIEKNVICLNGYSIGSTVDAEGNNLLSLYAYQCSLISNKDVYVYIEVDSTEKICKVLQSWMPDFPRVYERYQLKKDH